MNWFGIKSEKQPAHEVEMKEKEQGKQREILYTTRMREKDKNTTAEALINTLMGFLAALMA